MQAAKETKSNEKKNNPVKTSKPVWNLETNDWIFGRITDNITFHQLQL